MAKDSRCVIPVKLPDGRTLMISAEDHERLCAAAERGHHSVHDWLALNLPDDEEDLQAKMDLQGER